MVLKELEVREAVTEEMGRVRELLGQEHYLGAGRDVGRTLVQVIHHRDRVESRLFCRQRHRDDPLEEIRCTLFGPEVGDVEVEVRHQPPPTPGFTL